jgi:hypothetical protein
VLTVYGIETYRPCFIHTFSRVATALTVYGIETAFSSLVVGIAILFKVATALTVYGIETSKLQAYYNYQ